MDGDQKQPAFPVLVTPRLVLRELRPEDAEDAFLLYSDVEVMRFYDAPVTEIKQVRDMIAEHHRRFENNAAMRWAITLKGTDRVIGTCGYWRDNPPPETCWYATMSYVLARPYWNQGYTTEALGAIIRYGFEHYGLHRIEAYVAMVNPASIRVLQKVGFLEVGRMRERFWLDGRFYDEYMFALLTSDLPGDHDALLRGAK